MVDALLGSIVGPTSSAEIEPPTEAEAYMSVTPNKEMCQRFLTPYGGQAGLNHWQDSHYFTGTFPTLFPCGTGGHRDERPQ